MGDDPRAKERIIESGPAEELFNSDNAFVRQFLSGESQGPLGMEWTAPLGHGCPPRDGDPG